MKKSLKVLGVILAVLLLAGCGSKKEESKMTELKCTQDLNDSKYEMIVKLEEDVVKSISGTVVFEKETDAAEYETFAKFIAEVKKLDMGIKREGTKVTIDNFAPTLESDDAEDPVKVIDKTKEEFIKEVNKQNFICE